MTQNTVVSMSCGRKHKIVTLIGRPTSLGPLVVMLSSYWQSLGGPKRIGPVREFSGKGGGRPIPETRIGKPVASCKPRSHLFLASSDTHNQTNSSRVVSKHNGPSRG